MAGAMSPLRRLFVLAFWLCVLIAYVAAILPQREAPRGLGWDKLNHMLAFFTITFLFRLAYPRIPVWRVALLMAVFGGVIELSQAMPFIRRDAEWADWFADCAAVVAGLLVVWPLALLAEHRRRVRGDPGTGS